MISDPAGLSGLFAKFDYAETKDLAKSFLTLSATMLAFSVTFSEKIVDFKTARLSAKLFMVVSWALNVSSIVVCGLAICFLANALFLAIYFDDAFQSQAQVSYNLMLVAGVLFVGSLAALVISAVISLLKGPEQRSAINQDQAETKNSN